MRLVMGLTVVGAALLVSGLLLTIIGSALRLKSPHHGSGLAQLGEVLAIFGLAVGVVLIVVLAADLAGRLGRRARGGAEAMPARPLQITAAYRSPIPDAGLLSPLPSPATAPNAPHASSLQQPPVMQQPPVTHQPPVAQQPPVMQQPPVVHHPPAMQRPAAQQPPVAQQLPPAAQEHAPIHEVRPQPGPPQSGHPGESWRADAGGNWSPIPAYIWTPGARDEWESAGGWSPGQDDWAADRQDGWAHAGQDSWAPEGHNGWTADHQDGWSNGAQQQWAPPGREGWPQYAENDWTPPGQDGWAPAGQDDWSPGQEGWNPAGQGGWDAAGEGAWDPAGQGDWSNGGQQQWAPAGEYGWTTDTQGDWAPDGEGGWIPDGHGGWVRNGQDGWAAADHGGPAWRGQEDLAHAGQNGWAGQDGWADQTGWRTEEPEATPPAAPAEGLTAPAEQPAVPAEQPAVPAEELAALAGELAALAAELAVPTEIPAAPAEEPAAAAKGSEPEPDPAGLAAAQSDGKDYDTSPLPVIRDTDPPPPGIKPFSVWEPVVKKTSPEPSEETRPAEDKPEDAGRRAEAEPLSADTEQKLDKIKDLYLTAEAIGEEALVKHFDQVSKMQRSLISEFFEEAGLGQNGTPTLLASGASDKTDNGGAASEKGGDAADRGKSGWRAAVSRRRPRAPASPRPTGPPPPR
jgi:hypothetical protein